MTGWIDSHAHIFSKEYTDFEDVIERAKNANIIKILVVCCRLSEAEKAIEYAKDNSYIDVALGVHPSDISKFSEEDWNKLENLAYNPSVVAIGEIGLDLYWTPDNLEEQTKGFIRQIELANKLNKPIIVHSRDAIQKTYEILKEHEVKKKGIIHCFSSSAEMAQEFVKLGYTISLGGPVTFKNAVTPKEVAEKTPLDYLLVETDCPYLTPHPYRGKRNEPAYVALTAQEICRIKGIEEKQLQESCITNYNKLFHPQN